MVPPLVVYPNGSDPESTRLIRIGFHLAARVLVLLIRHVSKSGRMPASGSDRNYKTFGQPGKSRIPLAVITPDGS
jgi:hypothetical protein